MFGTIFAIQDPVRMPLPLRAHSATHPGLHHSRNEDAYSVLPTVEGGLLLVVCDGMGGMGRGDEASRLAIDVLCSVMSRSEGLPPERMRLALRAADQRIRDELCAEIEQPGATAVMVYVLDGAAHVAWVGDSRAYLVRDGRIVYRTRDHKLVEELVEAGQLTPEQAKESALAHVVTRALGGRPASEPPVLPATLGYAWKLHHGDRILLCSDGVSDLVDDDEISDLIDRIPPAEGTSRLVETALLRGGHDNITCILAMWEGSTGADDEVATPVIHPNREVGPERDSELDGRVTEEIDLVELEARVAREAKARDAATAARSRVASRGRDDGDLGFADQPTAEVDRADGEETTGNAAKMPPKVLTDPQERVWVGVGLGLVAIGLAAGLAAWLS